MAEWFELSATAPFLDKDGKLAINGEPKLGQANDTKKNMNSKREVLTKSHPLGKFLWSFADVLGHCCTLWDNVQCSQMSKSG